MSEPGYDLITVGRSSIDLYANQIGAPFPEIESFGAFVGGCPTNIAVGASRLGRRTALLTAVGTDPVGDFVLRFLERERIDTRFIPRKPGRRTSAVLLGIEPPDRFPLVFYRDGCADIALDIDDVLGVPLDSARAVLFTGTGLSREPSRSATLLAAELAHAGPATTFLDLDFRPDQWHDSRAYGITLRTALGLADFVIGTEEEVKAAASAGETAVVDSQMSSPVVGGDLGSAIGVLLARGPKFLVLKCGAEGAEVHVRAGEVVRAAPFRVEVVNVLGAGDAFAAGFIHGVLDERPLGECARMGNAAGAIVVTRHGCANFMPTSAELMDFVAERGGL